MSKFMKTFWFKNVTSAVCNMQSVLCKQPLCLEHIKQNDCSPLTLDMIFAKCQL